MQVATTVMRISRMRRLRMGIQTSPVNLRRILSNSAQSLRPLRLGGELKPQRRRERRGYAEMNLPGVKAALRSCHGGALFHFHANTTPVAVIVFIRGVIGNAVECLEL